MLINFNFFILFIQKSTLEPKKRPKLRRKVIDDANFYIKNSLFHSKIPNYRVLTLKI